MLAVIKKHFRFKQLQEHKTLGKQALTDFH